MVVRERERRQITLSRNAGNAIVPKYCRAGVTSPALSNLVRRLPAHAAARALRSHGHSEYESRSTVETNIATCTEQHS